MLELEKVRALIATEIAKLFKFKVNCVKVWYDPEVGAIVIKPDKIPNQSEFHEWLSALHLKMIKSFPEYDIVIHGMEEIDDILYPEVYPPLLLHSYRVEDSVDTSYQKHEEYPIYAESLVKAA